MAKVSRSNKKQPAFDPAELSDLIFTPAVGSGVGSHLLGTTEVTTVDKPSLATVDIQHRTTVDNYHVSTVDKTHQSTVDRAPHGAVPWVTEQGSLVPHRRVKRIGLAKDVINSTEEFVYRTLWTANPVPAGIPSGEHDPSRVVQAGYDYLAKQTQLSKRTIQRIVEKLIDKDFIAIERPADIYSRSSTVYRVFSDRTILDRHMQKGRFHVAKLGPGVSYVRRLDEIRLQ